MAERLTEIGLFIDEPVYIIKKGKKSAAINKLAQLEDILEKYGVESVEELEKKLADSDTWQKACELACDVLRDINYKIYNEDRIDFENTFYQQAKTEGNDE